MKLRVDVENTRAKKAVYEEGFYKSYWDVINENLLRKINKSEICAQGYENEVNFVSGIP